MREEPFDRAYASDLERAIETARTILGPSGVAVVVDARIREFDFGLWEGLRWDQIIERWPHHASDVWTDALGYHPEGGESFEDVVRRVGSFLADLEREPAQCVLVATHAGVLHAALRVLAPRLPQEQRALKVAFSPAGITRVTMDADGVRLISLNDVEHLNSPA